MSEAVKDVYALAAERVEKYEREGWPKVGFSIQEAFGADPERRTFPVEAEEVE